LIIIQRILDLVDDIWLSHSRLSSFSLASVDHILSGFLNKNDNTSWHPVWYIDSLESVWLFIRQALSDRILINVRMTKWGLGDPWYLGWMAWSQLNRTHRSVEGPQRDAVWTTTYVITYRDGATREFLIQMLILNLGISW
jgi:hypothetical protein